MTPHPIDPAMLSAFLDGTATEAERDEVMRALAADRERYAQFVEAVQIRAALDVEDATAAMTISAESRRPVAAAPAVTVQARTTTKSPLGQRLLAPLVLSAALIGVVLFLRDAKVDAARGDGTLLQVAQLVDTPTRGNGAVAQSLGADAMDPRWTVMRGSEDTQRVSARAFRAGVRVAQWEIAASAQDSSAIRLATDALQDLMRGVDGAAPVTATLNAATANGAPLDEKGRATVAQQVRTLTGAAAWYDLGVWTESARHAARRPQPAFFRQGTFAMVQLQRLLTESQDDPAWRDATEPLRSLVAPTAAGTVAMDAVLQALDAVALTAGG